MATSARAQDSQPGSQNLPVVPKPSGVFDVISIRPSSPGESLSFGATANGYNAHNTPLVWVILNAYLPLPMAEWRSDRLQGGPDWVRQEGFDIQARVSEDTAKEWASLSGVERDARLKAALRGMLVERCHLVVRSVLKEGPIFALTLKHGSRRLPERLTTQPIPKGIPIADGGVMFPSHEKDGWFFHFYNTSMSAFAEALSGLDSGANPPILDQTHLAGKYDFVLRKKEVDPGPEGSAMPAAPEPATLWEIEELGLELKRTKAFLPAVVIDQIDRPSQN